MSFKILHPFLNVFDFSYSFLLPQSYIIKLLRHLMHFSSFGTTINSNIIVNAITHYGIPTFHTSEIHLKPFLSRESVCNLADIIAVYKQSERFYVVGIEINKWDGINVYIRRWGWNIWRIKNHFKVLTNIVDDPLQRTILEFY